MSKKLKKKVDNKNNIEVLDRQIEDLELDEMSESEINVVIKAFSPEGVKLRAERKKVRYQLYRTRTEAEGKCQSDVETSFKEIFEKQAGFTGWRFFATNWDVAFDDPYRVVSRHLSEQEEWDNVVKSKFPTILDGGRVSYPDLQVKKRVEEESNKRRQ